MRILLNGVIFVLNRDYKVIEDFPEYMITSNGEVWSYKNKYKCRNGLRKLKPRVSRNGYEYVDLVDGNRKKRYQIHRLVAFYFCDGYFEGAVVNHIDANTRNNDYKNLEWVTHKENIHKSYETSGVDQTRNYCIYQIEMPDGDMSPKLKAGRNVKEYILNNSLDVKPSMLLKHRNVNGYKLHKIQ